MPRWLRPELPRRNPAARLWHAVGRCGPTPSRTRPGRFRDQRRCGPRPAKRADRAAVRVEPRNHCARIPRRRCEKRHSRPPPARRTYVDGEKRGLPECRDRSRGSSRSWHDRRPARHRAVGRAQPRQLASILARAIRSRRGGRPKDGRARSAFRAGAGKAQPWRVQ